MEQIVVEEPNAEDPEAPPPGKPICCGLAQEDKEDDEFGCVLAPLVLSVLIVVCGTASTITSKLQDEVRSDGYLRCPRHPDDDGDDDDGTRYCLFTKPWFQTLVMKVAMSTCLFICWFAKWRRGRKESTGDDLDAALLSGELPPKGPKGPTWGSIMFIAVPAFTDLLQTVLSQAGLLWVSSSTYQMTRGSVVIFTCALSVKYMGKVMHAVHYVSVGIVVLAIAVVGVAGLFAGDGGGGGDVGEYILGLLLIILGQVVGAVQFVLEEYLMADCAVSPTLLVGWEGLWGIVFFVVLAPILSLHATRVSKDSSLSSASAIWHENFANTWDQLKNSPDLQLITAVSMVALLIYNLVGNMVTKQLSAIMRSILESCRVLGVWITSIIIYYGFGNKAAGEAWTNWSYLEFLGFVLLVYGTVAYKEIVAIPCVSKPPATAPEQ